ncbi:MAG: hypothetical protein HYT73_03575 [Candidatus Aenigmarchaeota archaeon]|nr:hypothetical protein [Candidatus Aenigmarchaeota archaeon]
MKITYKPVLTGRTKDGLPVEVVDLVPLHGSDPETFGRLFRQGQRIYHSSFPPEEKESTDVIRKYIATADMDMRDGTDVNFGPGTFSYLVPMIDGKAEGMLSYCLVLCDGFSEILVGYAAVSKKHRNKGVATVMANAAVRNANRQSMKRLNTSLKYRVAEIEQPTTSYDDMMRDTTRPIYHQKTTGLGAAAIIDKKTGEMIPVPYAQPGIKERADVTPEPVPLVLGVAHAEKGRVKKIKAQPETVISPSGEVRNGIQECAVLDSGEFYKIADGVLNDYRSAVEDGTYDAQQIDGIQRILERGLLTADNDSVFLEPNK